MGSSNYLEGTPIAFSENSKRLALGFNNDHGSYIDAICNLIVPILYSGIKSLLYVISIIIYNNNFLYIKN